MITRSKVLVAVATIAAATSMAGAASANMLTNPGFEAGNLSSWTTYGSWYPSNNPVDVHSGTWAAVNSYTVTASTTPTATTYSGLYQNVVDTTAGGETFNASVWVSTAALNGFSEAYLQVQFGNSATGPALATYKTPAITASNQAYTELTLNNMVAPAGTLGMQIQAVVEGIGGLTATSNNTGYTRFDDFSLAPVPEPADAPLMALGIAGAALMFRRRRRA